MLVGIVLLVCSGCIIPESREHTVHLQRMNDVQLRVKFTCNVAQVMA